MTTLLQYGLGLFLAAHGIVHAWYVVVSRGWIDDEDGMGWNGQSWLLASILQERTILDLASVGYGLVTVGFVVGGVGYVLGAGWWVAAVAGAAVLSTATIVALWDGRMEQLAAKGVLGVVINLVFLAWLFA